MTYRQLAEKMAEALEGALRLTDMGYTYAAWQTSGGPDECRHGYAAGIQCPYCDRAKIKEALAAFREAHPTPTTPCTPSSQDPN